MAGLPWFELDTDFSDHPKVKALQSRLREPLADAYVARLYAYCYRHVRDRFEAHDATVTVEDACRWRGRIGNLFDALMAVGVLERDGGKVIVHGVKERMAPHVSKRQGDAERQKRRRDKVAMSVGRHAGVTADVTRDVLRESRSNKDKDKDREANTHTLGRAEGESDRAVIDAKRDDPPHPLMDEVVMALRSEGLKPLYPKNGARASVEATIAQVGVPVAVERIKSAWVVSKPWLTMYLEAIAPPPPKVVRRAVVLPPADGWEPAPGPPPDYTPSPFEDIK